MKSVVCPACSVSLALPEEAKPGARLSCPGCNAVFRLPAAPVAKPRAAVVPRDPNKETEELVVPRSGPAGARRPDRRDDAGDEESRDDRSRRRRRDDDEEDDDRPRRRRRDDDDEEDDRPRRRRRKPARKSSAAPARPFWKTRMGLILNGLGLVLLGAAGVAIFFLSDSSKRSGGLIAGIVCIFLGFGGIGKGIIQSDDDAPDRGADDDEGAGGGFDD